MIPNTPAQHLSSPEPVGTKYYRQGTLVYTAPGLILLVFWLLWGDFCANLMEAVIPNVVPLKLKSLGCSSTVISIFMTTLPGIIALFWNPIIASWSDRHRSRWGRRIPFMLGGTPAMVMILIGLGFCDPIGLFLASAFGLHLSADQTSIITIALLLILFHMCNAFVWSPYWALFNDTVPREVMGRFSVLFRTVTVVAVAMFSIYIFPHSQSHYREVFVGLGIFFGLAYAILCFNVKEGSYPPAPPMSKTGGSWSEKVATYFRECFGHRFYRYHFLASAFTVVGGATIPFILLMYNNLGLDLRQIGQINGWTAILTVPVFFIAGIFMDRVNIIKLIWWGRVIQTAICAGSMVFLFFDFKPQQVFAIVVILNLLLLVVTNAMLVALIPLNMRLLPQERFAQFSSAVGLSVGVAGIFAGFLAGGFIDLMRWFHGGSNFAYRYAPAWQFVFYAVASFFQYKVYRYVDDSCGNDIASFIPPDAQNAQAIDARSAHEKQRV